MNTNSDLASWGEPPSTPAERAMGSLLDKVLARLERGQAVKPESLRGDRPELVERGQALVRIVGLLSECAASVWENSHLEPGDDPGGSPWSFKSGESSVEARQPNQEENKMQVTPAAMTNRMPDPFPGEFLIRRMLGEGQFGKVWLAEEIKLGRQVALKTLKLPATSTMGPQVLAALRREAQYLALLENPNIVRVHAWREARGEYFLVLQFVAGGSLADKLKVEKVLSWQDAARYVADVGEALVAVHKADIIHRDIKPENILWDASRNEAMLTDFGVSARLAEPGTVAGTPMYMAPEAFDGVVSAALDVYSLAATLYRLATGEMPFARASLPNLIYQKLQGLPDPDPHCQAIPEALEQIIRSGLAGKPEDRPSLVDFAASLRGSLNRLLADALVTPTPEAGGKSPVNMRLVVSRRVQDGSYKSVATTKPVPRGLRDMKKVPQRPEEVSVRTGEWVRIEVVADKTGYVTVFNIGPTGNLNLLYPDEPSTTPPPVEANKPLHVLDVEMTPPVGRERVFAVWSKKPLPIRLEELRSLTEQGKIPGSRPYHSSRDMKRVQKSVAQSRPEDWLAVVLELDHR